MTDRSCRSCGYYNHLIEKCKFDYCKGFTTAEEIFDQNRIMKAGM